MRQRQVITAQHFLKRALEISDSFVNEDGTPDLDAPARIFYRQAQVRNGRRYTVPIPDTDAYGPLRGLFTDAPTYKLLRDIREPENNAVLKWYMRALTAPRFTKVVLNLGTQERNFLSNALFHVADGEFINRRHYMPAWKRTAAVMAGVARNQEAANETWSRLMRIGLITGSAHGQQMREDMRDALIAAEEMDPETWYQKYIFALPGKGAKLATAAYALGDNIPKTVAYFAKRARFGPIFQQRLLDAGDGEAFEGLNETYTFENRTEDGRFRLTDSDGVTHVRTAEEFTDREVVARIRSAMPYYDMAPRIITQFARRLPVGPDFLTFHFESVRCGVNNYRNAIHDLKHFGDVQPMLGTILAHSVAATRASAKWAPLALAAAATMRALGGREPDAEEEDALRDIMPPYRARNVMLVGRGEDGRYPYVDIGYLHPYDLLSTTAMAMQAPDGRKLETMADGLGEFFWGGTMAGKLFAHLVADVDEFGRPITSDLDGWWERLGDRAKYAFEALEPYLDHPRVGSASAGFVTRRSCRPLPQAAGTEADEVLPARPKGEVLPRRSPQPRRTESLTMARRSSLAASTSTSPRPYFMAGPGQTFLGLAMVAEVLAARPGAELLTHEGDVRTWGMHLTRATTPLRVRQLDVRQALRSRAAALHRLVADKKNQGNQAWRDYYERGYGTAAGAEATMAEVETKLYETATPLLQRLRDAGSVLGLTDVEVRAELRDAGFGKAELETFWQHGYLPYAPPTE